MIPFYYSLHILKEGDRKYVCRIINKAKQLKFADLDIRSLQTSYLPDDIAFYQDQLPRQKHFEKLIPRINSLIDKLEHLNIIASRKRNILAFIEILDFIILNFLQQDNNSVPNIEEYVNLYDSDRKQTYHRHYSSVAFQVSKYHKILLKQGEIIGSFSEGKLSGIGRQKHYDQKTEEGEFRNHSLHGRGRVITNNGDIIEGFFEYSQLSGKGIQKCSNGAVWKGEFNYGMLNGQGIAVLPNGDTLQGSFADNMLSGYGMVKRVDGEKRIGEFKKSEKNDHWIGARMFEDGREEEGRFEGGMLVQ